jgi:hypothetical protein
VAVDVVTADAMGIAVNGGSPKMRRGKGAANGKGGRAVRLRMEKRGMVSAMLMSQGEKRTYGEKRAPLIPDRACSDSSTEGSDDGGMPRRTAWLKNGVTLVSYEDATRLAEQLLGHAVHE